MSARTILAEHAELAKRLRAENPTNYNVVPLRTPLDEATELMEAIAKKHGETLRSLRTKGKFTSQVEGRRECYELLVARGWSTTQIGKYFNRDHTSVVHVLNEEKRAKRKGYMRKYYALGRGQ